MEVAFQATLRCRIGLLEHVLDPVPVSLVPFGVIEADRVRQALEHVDQLHPRLLVAGLKGRAAGHEDGPHVGAVALGVAACITAQVVEAVTP